jgi:hypothetical protein
MSQREHVAAAPKRRVEPFRSTERYIGNTDGVLYCISKGLGLVDGRSTLVERNIFLPDVEICNARVDGIS